MNFRGVLILLVICFCAGLPAQDDGWVLLDPAEVRSLGGATITRQTDGAWDATGPNPVTDTYEIKLRTDLPRITGFRLEVIPQKRGGTSLCGRAANGNFVLTEFKVAAAPVSAPERMKPVGFERALADHSQVNWRISQTLDKNPKTGWAIGPGFTSPHLAVFEVRGNVNYKSGNVLRITMDFQYGNHHTIGRFRLWATNRKHPLQAPDTMTSQAWIGVQRRIKSSIDNGVDALLSRQELDGSWSFVQPGYPSGQTGLCVYTLKKCGLDSRHPAILRAVAYMKSHLPKKTYSTATVLMALCEVDANLHSSLIKRLVKQLSGWQKENGFGYPGGAVDLSNTQYAAIALRTAAKKGIKVKRDVWEKLVRRAQRHQNETKNSYLGAPFGYRPGSRGTASMTSAGISVLAICEEQLNRRSHSMIVARDMGVTWLGRHFSVTSNFQEKGNRAERWLYYYLYGLERVGGLLGIEEIGGHSWYKLGARFLVESQNQKTGVWGTAYGEAQPNTCFALLFLTKATGSSSRVVGDSVYGVNDPAADVSLRASGDSPLIIWVSRFGDATREKFGWIEDERKDLRIRRVEYHVASEQDMKSSQLLVREDGDPSKKTANNRYAIKHKFDLPGNYWLQARAWLVPTDGTVADASKDKKIQSAPLRVRIDTALDERLLAYAADDTRNALFGRKVEAKASTEFSNYWAAVYAVDNRQARAWLCKDNDPAPKLELRIPGGVRADTLLLSHPRTDESRRNRVKTVEVKINGRRKIYSITMEKNITRKAMLKLDRPLVVRRVELKILDVHKLDPKRKGVGFGEVELHLHRGQ